MNPEYGTIPALHMLQTEPLTFEGICSQLERINKATRRNATIELHSDGSGCIALGFRQHKCGNFRDSAEFGIAVEEIIQEESRED